MDELKDFESGHDDPGYPKDWRGNDIGVFTKVIHKGNGRYDTFKIGTVTGFTPGGMLRVTWDESPYPRDVNSVSLVWPGKVTVFSEGPN